MARTTKGSVVTANHEMLDRIAQADFFDGKPIVRDIRIAIKHTLGMLASGGTTETMLREYPDLEAEDTQA